MMYVSLQTGELVESLGELLRAVILEWKYYKILNLKWKRLPH